VDAGSGGVHRARLRGIRPRARGVLTGAFKTPEDLDATDYRRSNPRFSSENYARNLRLVETIAQIAREAGYTSAQVALAWLLDCAPYVVPIPGTRSIKRLKENALSVMVRLQEAQLERLYGILRERPASGARYTPTPMAAASGGALAVPDHQRGTIPGTAGPP
jgi:aryl-alcohol dehydrogenase-like predicted oxidoreductase